MIRRDSRTCQLAKGPLTPGASVAIIPKGFPSHDIRRDSRRGLGRGTSHSAVWRPVTGQLALQLYREGLVSGEGVPDCRAGRGRIPVPARPTRSVSNTIWRIIGKIMEHLTAWPPRNCRQYHPADQHRRNRPTRTAAHVVRRAAHPRRGGSRIAGQSQPVLQGRGGESGSDTTRGLTSISLWSRPCVGNSTPGRRSASP